MSKKFVLLGLFVSMITWFIALIAENITGDVYLDTFPIIMVFVIGFIIFFVASLIIGGRSLEAFAWGFLAYTIDLGCYLIIFEVGFSALLLLLILLGIIALFKAA